MSELHWHPFYEEWVAVAGARQGRPNLPKTDCPFCPGSWKVPAQYEAISVPNDFPSLHLDSEAGPGGGEFGLYGAAPATGVCEVLLYSSVHTQTFSTLTQAQVDKVLDLWKSRYAALGGMKEIHYVFIFENKGQVIGATIPHPHGQIYAFGHLPPKITREVQAQERYLVNHGRCLGCDLAQGESGHPERIVVQNEGWIATVPWHARYPFEVQVLPRRHLGSLLELRPGESTQLNSLLREVTRRYDGLFGFSLPYMMLQHARPTDGQSYPGHHFRISFLPLHRGAEKIKYIAGCETGAGTYITDMTPEWAAEQLQRVVLT
jgi:UDPglucose--hexose-1-phosphate uridylyltransferase